MNLAATRAYRVKNSFLFAALILFFTSCSVKDYPIGKPFVYNATVHVVGDTLGTAAHKDLESRIRQQLHDSIAVRRVSKFFIASQLKNPPVYDSANADKSLAYISALMHSLGYYRDSARYTADTARHKDQLRTTLNFYVYPGKLTHIDSVSIALNDTIVNSPRQAASLDTLQALTRRNQSASPIKKGAPFAKPLLSSELDRLVDIYHNNGYLRFSREELMILWDTVGLALLRPAFDPLEQARLLEALQRRRENPVADIEYRLRPVSDSTRLIRYYIGNITIFPDLTVDNSKLPMPVPEYDTSGMVIRSYANLFKHRVLTSNVYFRRGQLFDQRLLQRTANRFNAIPAWRIASVDGVPRPGTDSVDMVVRLTPARKYAFDANIEGSQNLGGLFVGSNLVGVNLSVQNRNFARRAIQATYSAGVATELNSQITQTVQVSGAYSLVFPRLIWPKNWKVLPFFPALKTPYRSSMRTSLAFNTRYIHRIDYLDLLSVAGSWGYDGARGTNTASTRLFNVEYTAVNRMSILNELIENNKTYKYIFNDGLILSTIFNRSWTKVTDSSTRTMRLGIEPSGIFSGLIRTPFLEANLKRFLKVDFTYQKNWSLGRNRVIAARGLLGVGKTFIYNNKDSNRFYMPFFRAYFAGGANSMRGWPLRKLGPGSSIRSFATDSFPERFGDMQLELNGEFRFQIANIGGIFINSAVFTDIGNVWYLRKNPSFPDGEFNPSRLWTDMAIDVGTGVRIDFGFLKFRVDYAFKAKDPSTLEARNKYFYNFNLLKGTVQLGVDYPF
jgi:outer membrane protein insertion porin family